MTDTTQQHNTTPSAVMATAVGPTHGLLVLSCDPNTFNSTIIAKILKEFAVNSGEVRQTNGEYDRKRFNSNDGIDCYDLKLDNKYYSADIMLFDVKNKDSVDEEFFECVDGIIVYFDANQESSFSCVESCLPFMSQFINEIKLLICESIGENNSESQKIQKWCIDNEFELIELSPEEELVDEPFEQMDGISRLRQAIQAHSWPDSQLKDGPVYKPSSKFKEMIDKEVFNSINDVKEVFQNGSDSFDRVTSENENLDDIEKFEDLFSSLGQLKAKSSQMNDIERKKFAEKVTLAFWKAVNGDPNEVEGIENLDDFSDLNLK